MAEKSNNVDELNRLAQDGRIAQKEDDKEHKKDVQEASKGKKTVEEVEQIIDETELLEELYRNKMFANMIQPCLLEGENLLGKLKGYFEVHKVRPSDLVKEIQTQVNERRLEINRDSQTLFFGEDGSIDEGLSIEKAVKNQRPVARYIRNVYMEEGKQLPEMEDHTLHGKFILSEQPREYFDVLNHQIAEMTTRNRDDFWKIFGTEGKVVETPKGNSIPIYSGLSQEGNIFVGKLYLINEKLSVAINPDELSDIKRKGHLTEVIACYKELQELEKLSTEELKMLGLTQEQIKGVIDLRERVKKCAQTVYMGMTHQNIEELTDEQLKEEIGEENWGKISGKRDGYREEAQSTYLKYKDEIDLSSDEKIVLSAEQEVERANKIRLLRILRRLEKRTDERFSKDEDDEIDKRLGPFYEKYPELVNESLKNYEDTQEIELLSRALIREKLVNDIDRFERKGFGTKDVGDSPAVLKAQYSRLKGAIIAANIDTKEASEEDLALRKRGISLLVKHFPELVDEVKDEYDEKTISEIKNRMFNIVKNKYAPVFGEDSIAGIQNYGQLADKLELRYIYRVKNNLVTVLNDNSVAKSGIEQILQRSSFLDYMKKESDKEKKELFENNLYLNLTNDILKFKEEKALAFANGKKLSEKQENEFIVTLATVVQMYEVQSAERYSGRDYKAKSESSRNKQLLNEAKRNLADLLPQVFDSNGEIYYPALEHELDLISLKMENGEIAKGYKEFEEEMMGDPDSAKAFMDSNSRMIYLGYVNQKELENSLNSNTINIASRKETKEKTEQALNDLNQTIMADGSLRVLQLVHYMGDKRQDKKAEHYRKKYGYKGSFRTNKNSGTFKDAVEAVETAFEKKIRALYKDDQNVKKELDKIKHHDFDDTIFPGMIREGKRKAANKRIDPIIRKYIGNENELDEEAKNIVLSTYLAIIDDDSEKTIPDLERAGKDLNARLLRLMERINPDIIKEGNVNLDLVFEEFKKVTKKSNIDDIEDAKFAAEDELTEEFLVGLVKDKSFEKAINNENLRTGLKVFDSQEKISNFETLHNLGNLLNCSFRTRYDLTSVKSDEVELIKGLYLIAKLYGDSNLDREGLSVRNAKVQSVEKKLLNIAKDNLKIYFHGVLDDENNIDKEALDKAVMGYLEKNAPEFVEELNQGNDLVTLLKRDLENRQKVFIGPPVRGLKEEGNLDNQIIKLEEDVKLYEETKEDFRCIAMINIASKMRQRIKGVDSKEKIARGFDSKRNGISKKINLPEYQMEIDDSYIDSVLVMGARRQIEKINEKYFSDEGKNLDDVSERFKIDVLFTAMGAIDACDKIPDYKAITKGYDAKNVAIDIIKKVIPEAVNEKREIDKEKFYEEFCNICEASKFTKPRNFNNVISIANKRIGMEIVREFFSYDYTEARHRGEDLPYFDILENSKLRSTIKSEREDPGITNSEMDPVFQSRAETLDVDDKKVKEAKDTKTVENKGKNTEQPVIGDAEVDKAMADKSEELHHDVAKDKDVKAEAQDKTGTEEKVVEETSTPKVEQQSDKLNKDTKGIAVENINVAPVEPEKSMITTESRGFMSDVITKIKNIPNLIKNGINNIKERLGIGQSSSSNNTETGSTSTSSTGGVTKTEQDVVQNLTGYGQQNLDLNAAKAATQNETGKKVSEKGNELEGNEENERD